MTKFEAFNRIKAQLDALTDEQVETLVALAEAFSVEALTEDERTLAAIQEGVAQAKSGERASQAVVDKLLGSSWR
jgi:hypothetical protein